MKKALDCLRKHQFTLIAFFIYLAAPFIIYLGYLFSGHVMVSGDGVMYLNLKSLFADSYLKGDPILWNRYTMLGVPYFADIQTSYLYPLSLLSLIMPVNIYSNLFYFLNLTMGGFFTYLFMNEIQEKKIVSFVTGLIFMLSITLGGARVSHLNVYASIVWFPLVLCFVQRYIGTGKRKELLYAAIAMALQYFAGFPQVAIYSDIFVFIYLIVFMKKDKSTIKRKIMDLGIWIGIYLMLIAVQFLPLLQLVQDTGRNQVPYEFFSVYSADYRILPMTVFPELFVDIYAPFGIYHALEIGIEIYVGIFVTSFTIYAAIFHMKEKKIRWLILFICLALVYCMIGNIPILGRLIYSIPIIGSFRAQSRILFIYVFYSIVVFGLILSKLNDKSEAKRLLKFSCVIFTAIIIITIVVKSVASSMLSSQQMQQYYNGIKVFLPSILFSLLLVAVMAAYTYLKFFYEKKHAYIVLSVLLTAICLLDVTRYSLRHEDYEFSDSYKNASSLQYIQKQSENEEYRSIAVLSTPEELYDTNLANEYKYNTNLHYQFSTYNAYITFESKRVRDLFSLSNAVMMPNLNDVIHSKNAAFSMSSIKYIVDPYHEITEDPVIAGAGELSDTMPDVDIPSNHSQVNVQAKSMAVSSNETYYVRFSASTSKVPTIFYIDFYGQNYDLEECSLTPSLKSGTHTYTGVISTGNGEVPDDVCIRIVSQSDVDIQISDFKVYKVKTLPFDSVYKKIVDDGQTLIYENINAKPIINIADNVADVSQYNDYLVDQTSFIENPKADAVGNDAKVEILEIKNNSVKAKVTANEEVFINHTQDMYPGWNVYVDGQKTQNYLVNKVIQGTYVPEGEHIVEFRFEPISIYIGAAITLAGIILLTVLIKRDKNITITNELDRNTFNS